MQFPQDSRIHKGYVSLPRGVYRRSFYTLRYPLSAGAEALQYLCSRMVRYASRLLHTTLWRSGSTISEGSSLVPLTGNSKASFLTELDLLTCPQDDESIHASLGILWASILASPIS